jgi:hypothetical protein
MTIYVAKSMCRYTWRRRLPQDCTSPHKKAIKLLNFEFNPILMTVYITSSQHIPFLHILQKMNDMFFNILVDRILRLLSQDKQNALTMAKGQPPVAKLLLQEYFPSHSHIKQQL